MVGEVGKAVGSSVGWKAEGLALGRGVGGGLVGACVATAVQSAPPWPKERTRRLGASSALSHSAVAEADVSLLAA